MYIPFLLACAIISFIAYRYIQSNEILLYYTLMEKELERRHDAFFTIYITPKLGVQWYELTEEELLELRMEYIAFMSENINNNKILRKFVSKFYHDTAWIMRLEDMFTKEIHKLIHKRLIRRV